MWAKVLSPSNSLQIRGLFGSAAVGPTPAEATKTWRMLKIPAFGQDPEPALLRGNPFGGVHRSSSFVLMWQEPRPGVLRREAAQLFRRRIEHVVNDANDRS